MRSGMHGPPGLAKQPSFRAMKGGGFGSKASSPTKGKAAFSKMHSSKAGFGKMSSMKGGFGMKQGAPTQGTPPPKHLGRRASRRVSTVIGLARPGDDGNGNLEDNIHDLLLNEYISMGYQKIGDSLHIIQPFDRSRILLDWCFLSVTAINVLAVPVQVAFGWPAYWQDMFVFALLLDVVLLADIASYMFTGFFAPASDDLGDDDEDDDNSDGEETKSGQDKDAAAKLAALQPASPTSMALSPKSGRGVERKKSFSRRASAVTKTDPTLTKVVEDAGIPKLILDHGLVLLNYMHHHAPYDALVFTGIICDTVRVRGNLTFLLLFKLLCLRKAYFFTLPNLTTHSRGFKYLLSVTETQAAILYYVLYLVLFCHWAGCLFLFFAWEETHVATEAEGGDTEYSMDFLGNTEKWDQYATALYWALQTTLTVGYGDVSTQRETVVMMVYSCIIVFMSLLVSTFFTASTTVWLSNLDASQREFKRKLHVLKDFMTVYRSSIPPDLRGKLYLYLDFNYRQNQSTNMMEELLDGMPKQVQTAVKLATTQDLIRKVKLFQNVSKSFISAIVMLLKPSVVLKGDTIFRFGDHGDEMYFLNKGHLSVMLPKENPAKPAKKRKETRARSETRRHSPVLLDDPTQENYKKVASLRSGAYFGEIALFTTSTTRTATIQAVVNSTYFTLSRDDFNRIRPSFPDVDQMLRDRAQSILKQNKQTQENDRAMRRPAADSGAVANQHGPSSSSGAPATADSSSTRRLTILRDRALAATQGSGQRRSLMPHSPGARGGAGVVKRPEPTDKKVSQLKRGSIFVNTNESAETVRALAASLGRLGDDDDDEDDGSSESSDSDEKLSPTSRNVEPVDQSMLELSGQLALVVAAKEVLTRFYKDTENRREIEDEVKVSHGNESDEGKQACTELILCCKTLVDPNQDVRDDRNAMDKLSKEMEGLTSRYEENDAEDLFEVVREECASLVTRYSKFVEATKPGGGGGGSTATIAEEPVPVAVFLAASRLLTILPESD